MSKENKVMRICLRCKNVGEQNKEFSYLGDGIWSCNKCQCKYTEIESVVEQAIEDSNENYNVNNPG
jgi:ribosomal protein L37AE/L43A